MEALFLIDGIKISGPLSVNPFPGQTDEIQVDTTKMTVLEIACCLSLNKLLDYLIKELVVRNDRDFCRDRSSKSIDE